VAHGRIRRASAEEWNRRNHIAQGERFVSDWLFHIGRIGFVQLQWGHVYAHPDADFHADQDTYSYSDVYSYSYSYSHPHAPAHRVDSLAHQRYLGLQ
jgi:hypothetical protein